MPTNFPVQLHIADPTRQKSKLWLHRAQIKGEYALRIGSGGSSLTKYHTTNRGSKWIHTESQDEVPKLWLDEPCPALAEPLRRKLFWVVESLGSEMYAIELTVGHKARERLWLIEGPRGEYRIFAQPSRHSVEYYNWNRTRGWEETDTGAKPKQALQIKAVPGMDELRDKLFPFVLGATGDVGQPPRGKFAIDREAFYLTVNTGPLTGCTFHFSLNGNGPGSFSAKDGNRYARLTDHRYRAGGAGGDVVLTDFDGKVYHYDRSDVSISSEKPGGMKYSVGKRRFSLFPLGVMKEILGVLEYGAKKYGVENWKVVPDARTEYFNAVHRHLDDWQNGELRDRETGFLHMAHLLCDAAFLCWFDLNPEFKIVPKPPISK